MYAEYTRPQLPFLALVPCTDASILVYKFCPERTSFNMYAEYTRPQFTLLALVPWVQASDHNFDILYFLF